MRGTVAGALAGAALTTIVVVLIALPSQLLGPERAPLPVAAPAAPTASGIVAIPPAPARAAEPHRRAPAEPPAPRIPRARQAHRTSSPPRRVAPAVPKSVAAPAAR